jgi:hypothetical protein
MMTSSVASVTSVTSVTLVTSFTLNVNKREDRKIEDYIKHGKILLKQKYDKVVFIDSELIPELEEYCKNECPDVNNKFIPYSLEDMFLYQHKDKFPKHDVVGNKEKDTQNYFIIMNNKTEFMKIAVEQNYYNHSNFVWIDFGIFHIFKDDEVLFTKSLESLNYEYTEIRAGSCWHPSKCYRESLTLNSVTWFFAGGIFGGNKINLLVFSELAKKEILEIVEKHNTITWEVNVWYEVYKKYPQLFSLYECDHNYTLVSGYSTVPSPSLSSS